MTTTEQWTKSSWKTFPALQQPNWPNQAAVDKVLGRIIDAAAACLRR